MDTYRGLKRTRRAPHTFGQYVTLVTPAGEEQRWLFDGDGWISMSLDKTLSWDDLSTMGKLFEGWAS